MYPMFHRCTPLEIAAISVLAGVGEEVAFAAPMQPELGLIVTSLLFRRCSTSVDGPPWHWESGRRAWARRSAGWRSPRADCSRRSSRTWPTTRWRFRIIRWGPALPDTNGAGRMG